MRWTCFRTESSNRATRKSSAAARAEPRARSLYSRLPSQNGSRRPDRRIWGERGSAPCAPTLWKEEEGPFSVPPVSIDMSTNPPSRHNSPAPGRVPSMSCRARSTIRSRRSSHRCRSRICLRSSKLLRWGRHGPRSGRDDGLDHLAVQRRRLRDASRTRPRAASAALERAAVEGSGMNSTSAKVSSVWKMPEPFKSLNA